MKIEMDALHKVRPEYEFMGKNEMKVWEVVAEKNLPVVLHMTQDERSVKEGEGVLELLKRWPELNFVICHIGVPPFTGWQQRAMLAQHPNVYLDIAAAYWFYHEDHGETYPVPSGPGRAAVGRGARRRREAAVGVRLSTGADAVDV